MPNIYAHFYTGKRALELAGTDVAAAAQRSLAAYRTGCQGPDPFYYAGLRGSRNRYMHQLANRLHMQRTDLLMAALVQEAQQSPAALAYTLGFLTHYALDCHTHPYVYHVTCRKHHVCFEAQMDTALNLLNGMRLEDFPPETILPANAQERRELDQMWTRVIQAVHGDQVPGGYAMALRHMRLVLGLAYDPRGKKRQMLQRLERMSQSPAFVSRMLVQAEPRDGVDYLNLNHAPWHPAWAQDEVCCLSVPELVENAAEFAAKLQQLVLEAVDTGETAPALAAIGDKNMDTGRSWRESCPLTHVRCAYQEEAACGEPD